MLTSLSACLALASITLRVEAQAQPPAAIDTPRGTVKGGTRSIGLGGAFVAIADDTDGVAINPASTAVRLPYSWQTVDYGLGLDVAIGAWLPKNDIYNQGDASNPGKSSALFGSLAATLNYEHLGLGLSAEAQSNAASRQDRAQGIAPTDLAANFGMVHANLAYGFLDGQLLLGAGPRLVGLSFDSKTSDSSALRTAGVGYEAGVIVKPIIAQYRLAAAVKSPIDANIAAAPGAPSGTLHVPWEVSLGFAYQLGARPLNPPFTTGRQLARRMSTQGRSNRADVKRAERELFEGYLRRQRWYLLVSSELTMIQGGGQLGLGAAAVADAKPVLSPRLGIESEVVPRILRLRAGSYYEQARTSDADSRLHATGGFDVRLFRWGIFGLLEPFDYWRISVAVDAARSYLNTGFSIGLWH